MAGLLRLVCAIPPAEPDLRLSPHPALHQMSQTRGSGTSAFPPSSSGSYIPSPAWFASFHTHLTAPLRHVASFPDLGLLRGLCHTSDIGRRLAYSVAGEPDELPKFA